MKDNCDLLKDKFCGDYNEPQYLGLILVTLSTNKSYTCNYGFSRIICWIYQQSRKLGRWYLCLNLKKYLIFKNYKSQKFKVFQPVSYHGALLGCNMQFIWNDISIQHYMPTLVVLMTDRQVSYQIFEWTVLCLSCHHHRILQI